MVMGAKLNLRLRVLIPAVENSVSGTAMRPGDVFNSRKGLTVEIGNTDAEGRLILADALADADDEKPELLIDVATLTGAARAATGMELPPFFTDDEKLAADLVRVGAATQDPLWRLPLWRGYEDTLDQPGRRSQQQSRLWLCRRHHRRAVPQPLCRQNQKLGASGHSRLDRPRQARAGPSAAKPTARARSMRC